MANFAGAHPEIATFDGWAKAAPWTGSYAEEAYNSLNSFIFSDASRKRPCGALVADPAAQPVSVPPEELAKRPHNFLETEITDRIKGWSGALDDAGHRRQRRRSDLGPQQGVAARPAQRRGRYAHRRNKIEAEADGPCRDINFDPTVLPNGIRTSDYLFPAARSSAYRVSYDRRTAEDKDYPRNATGAAQ